VAILAQLPGGAPILAAALDDPDVIVRLTAAGIVLRRDARNTAVRW
jgi:hypothetical protein